MVGLCGRSAARAVARPLRVRPVSRPAAARTVRPWLRAGALARALAGLGGQRARPGALSAPPLNDFVQYGAAARLTLGGENPYDPGRVEELERQAGRDADVLLMWNPPW